MAALRHLLFIFLVFFILSSYAYKFVSMGDDDYEKYPELFNYFIRLASNSSVYSPFIGIVTAASVEPEKNYELYSQIFQGAFKVNHVEWIPIDIYHINNNSNPAVLRQLELVNGIWFCGGDQMNLVKSFYIERGGELTDSPALRIIRDRFNRGELAIAGTSAGTAIMSGKQNNVHFEILLTA